MPFHEGAQQGDVDWIASRSWTLDDPFQVGSRQPRPSPGGGVRRPFVLGAAQHRSSHDEKLPRAGVEARRTADMPADRVAQRIARRMAATIWGSIRWEESRPSWTSLIG